MRWLKRAAHTMGVAPYHQENGEAVPRLADGESLAKQSFAKLVYLEEVRNHI